MWPPLLSVSERGEIINKEQGLRGFILLVKIEREGKRGKRREKKKVALGTEISTYYSVYPSKRAP
jgi:hypothetical protein